MKNQDSRIRGGCDGVQERAQNDLGRYIESFFTLFSVCVRMAESLYVVCSNDVEFFVCTSSSFFGDSGGCVCGHFFVCFIFILENKVAFTQ